MATVSQGSSSAAGLAWPPAPRPGTGCRLRTAATTAGQAARMASREGGAAGRRGRRAAAGRRRRPPAALGLADAVCCDSPACGGLLPLPAAPLPRCLAFPASPLPRFPALQHLLQIHHPVQHGPAQQQRLDRQPGVDAATDSDLVLGQEPEHPQHIARLEAAPVAAPASSRSASVMPFRARSDLEHEQPRSTSAAPPMNSARSTPASISRSTRGKTARRPPLDHQLEHLARTARRPPGRAPRAPARR